MADPFSLAAGSFAVVGLVDIILRASSQFCHLISDVKDAPANVERLRTCVQENSLLVEALKQYLNEIRSAISSTSASAADSRQALDLFTLTITALKRELESLLVLSQKHNETRKTWGAIKLWLDERKVNSSLRSLESSKSTLAHALMLLGWGQSSLSQKRIETAMQQNVQRIVSDVKTHLHDSLRELSTIRDDQKTILLGQTKAASISIQQNKQTHLMRKDFHLTVQREHEKTRGQIHQSASRIDSGIENLHKIISKSTTAAPKSRREILFVGERRDTILMPLLLFKDEVRTAIFKILSRNIEQVSSEHLYWLLSEFENLVSSATQEVAALSQGSTATSFDTWSYSQEARAFSGIGTASNALNQRGRSQAEDDVRTQNTRSHGVNHRKRLFPEYESFSSTSLVGQLRIAVPRSNKRRRSAHALNEANLSFLPNASICATSIAARFVNVIEDRSKPRLYAHINAFKLSGKQFKDHGLLRMGSLEEVDAALRSGSLSPYELDENEQYPCLWWAAATGRLDLFEYFDSQGIGLSSLNGEDSALDGLQFAIGNLRDDSGLADSISRVLTYLEEKMTECASPQLTSLLHANGGWYSLIDCPNSKVRLKQMWMEFLRREDYDFEHLDKIGNTPLLHHLKNDGGHCLATVRLLLGFGVDIHATDYRGRNAIQCAMLSTDDEFPELLEEKLSLLIEAGADIHHRDKWGDTPSHDARYHYKCWSEWRQALKHNGLDILDVVKEEEDWELLEEIKVDESDACESSSEDSGAEEAGEEESEVGGVSTEGRFAQGGDAPASIAE